MSKINFILVKLYPHISVTLFYFFHDIIFFIAAEMKAMNTYAQSLAVLFVVIIIGYKVISLPILISIPLF